MEFVPRITRAQSMDALSSMASIAGYKAVLIAATTLPRLFPMMTTAAGTMPPARVLIMGAGVAGLQAIATARRLGAVVSGYDVRAAVKEQIESLGAKFVIIDLGAQGEGEGGYARALDDATIRRQREQMALVMKEQDVVITTAAVPGRKAPLLITREMVHAMNPGSVIVDLAAERGGNCEVTRPGETVVERGVTVLGPVNVPATVPRHASEMYARNIVTLLKNMVNKEGKLNIDLNDEITRETLVTRGGEVVNAKVQALLGSERMSGDLEVSLYVLVLAVPLGLELVRRVSPLLHTPLMSLTNAISAISVVGAILVAGSAGSPTLSRVLGCIAVTCSTINIVAGFLITDRMLKMFRKKESGK